MLKKYWFPILIELIVVFFAALFVVVALSPRQDSQNRGFIPCTDKLIEDLSACGGNKICAVETIVANTWCDFKVMGEGVSLWLGGKQPRPWSNYLFEPEWEEETDEDLLEFYRNNPDLEKDMRRLIELEKGMED
jgi:hypothetical protein